VRTPPDAGPGAAAAEPVPARLPLRGRTSRRPPSGLLGSGLHCCAQACRRGARVRSELRVTGPDGTPLQRAELGLVAEDADREGGRAGAAALPLAQEPLHDPVLERVEGDDGEPA